MQLNREKLAELLGCSLRTVDEYARQGMPGEAPKTAGHQWRFESSVVISWLRDRERTDALGEVARVDETEAKRRKLAAEASLAEHELAMKQGAAVAIADFEAAWAAMIGAARAKMLGLPGALAPELAICADEAECAALIETAVREALLELSELNPELPIEPDSDSVAESGDGADDPALVSPARSDSKRVGGRGKTAQFGVQQ